MKTEVYNHPQFPETLPDLTRAAQMERDLCPKDDINKRIISIPRPWWFVLCKKCRQADSGGVPSWEPPMWERICPAPFCPTYRQFARVLALFLVGLLCWGVVFAVLGHTAAPGGQLFSLAALCIAAHFGGWLFSLVNVPALVGMLVVGILFQNVGFVHIDSDYKEFVSVLRRIALVIILTRAGLDLDPMALKKLWVTVLKIGLVPWFIECGVVALIGYFLLDLPLLWGLLLGKELQTVPEIGEMFYVEVPGRIRATVTERLARSPPTKANRVQSPARSLDFRTWESCRTMPLVGRFFRGSPVSLAPLHFGAAPYSLQSPSSALKTSLSIIAAVSPAVVVPSLCRLRGKGYGVSKGIPTLIIAVSGIDDATSVAAFGIIHSIMFTSGWRLFTSR
ncbi:hypothetical protein PR048_031748 [Dryococelus australis]|uniref:Cation/H+ exchanger transmembrane domain-containing protein n=1 Tax=Dryococelus australis TaxID=614101 RepID=A0ABQ9G650_9NEOP|nr:hypothetical protein PR048_031748 [Dryococelus australis]